VNGAGFADYTLVTGPGTAARFAVVSGRDNSTLLMPSAAPFGGDFAGGAFVAAGDLDGGGRAEWVFTPDQGGGANVVIYSLNPDGALSAPRAFFALGNPAFRDGARVAVGGVDPDGFADLVAGGGPGSGPRVLALNGRLLAGGDVAGACAAPLANFFVAGDVADRGGARLAVKDADADGRADVIAGSGEGSASRTRVYPGRGIGPGGEPAGFQDLDPFGQTPPAEYSSADRQLGS
jgi:hypothetical protein